MKTRIYFLDNLRTFLIFLVVLLHAGLVYEHVLENSWIVVDPVKSNNIGLIRMYLDLFVMFTIFFISGYFVRYSVKGKSAIAFIQSKFKRILLPWVVAVLTLIPAYKVLFLYSRGLPQEEWFSYFHFFERAGTDLSFFANNPVQNWLWFLPILFIFQLIYLGLSKTRLLSLSISLKTGVLLTFVLGTLSSILIAMNGLAGWTHNLILHFQNERVLVYFLAFLLGTLCSKLQVFESKTRNRKYTILSNVTLTISLGIYTAMALNFFFNLITPGRNYFYISEFTDRILLYSSALLAMLSFLYVLIDVFRFRFNQTNTLLQQLNRASYAVYIIHMIVLGLLATALLPLGIPAFLKFLLLTILTFSISNLLVYAYQLSKQKRLTSTSVATALVVVLMLGAAFKGPEKLRGSVTQEVPIEQSAPSQQVQSIHAAVISGNLEAVKQLLDAGTDVNDPEPAGGSSPLISAIVFDKTDIALALIEAGADVNFKNKEGSTPLHSAAFFCRTELVKELLEHGADKAIRNNAGSTALESIVAPFEMVKPIYDYFSKVYAPLGLELDYEQIHATRPIIARLLQP
ncbi:acyltransferase family protein [uncultured Sunxiuqinia sp.]|uniref:acyltransferase family protein n=1 Tax=uncultured Sunxiuqinia sp. TaxID=1573825 RepID=UPI00261884AD|nr:acyltransferase family protein [uncultured Sunxiuqinia sp.]